MKRINFVNPANTKKAFSLLIDCCFAGFKYEETADYLKEIGYYIPEDQFKSFNCTLNIGIDLDVGIRKNENN